MPRLHYHPFAQYCQKVLIALYEHDIAFERVIVDLSDPAQRGVLQTVWPFSKFPALEAADGTILGESGVIIEYLDSLVQAAPLVPDGRIEGLEPRMLERVIDGFIADPLARMVFASFTGQPVDTAAETATIATAYDFLEARLKAREWGAGADFGLADCAAGPALFYANLRVPLGDRPLLAAYFDRLRARRSFARVIDEARPYREGTPFDWPAGY